MNQTVYYGYWAYHLHCPKFYHPWVMTQESFVPGAFVHDCRQLSWTVSFAHNCYCLYDLGEKSMSLVSFRGPLSLAMFTDFLNLMDVSPPSRRESFSWQEIAELQWPTSVPGWCLFFQSQAASWSGLLSQQWRWLSDHLFTSIFGHCWGSAALGVWLLRRKDPQLSVQRVLSYYIKYNHVRGNCTFIYRNIKYCKTLGTSATSSHTGKGPQ